MRIRICAIAFVLVGLALCVHNTVALAEPWSGATKFGKSTEKVLEESKLTLNVPVVGVPVTENGVTTVDSAALLDSDAEQIYKVSLDYNHYDKFAPYVSASHLVRTDDDDKKYASDTLFVWTKMKYVAGIFSIEPSYFLRVHHQRNVLTPKDFGIRWTLERPAHQGWTDPVSTEYFSVLDGSWYILPLEGGKTYVRYFVKVSPKFIPDPLVSAVLGKPLTSGVKDLILAIHNRAKQAAKKN